MGCNRQGVKAVGNVGICFSVVQTIDMKLGNRGGVFWTAMVPPWSSVMWLLGALAQLSEALKT